MAMENTEENNTLSIVVNDECAAPVTQPMRKRKRKSMVWEHFTVEIVSSGCRRAICNQCKQAFAYSNGSKVVGTSHLKRHIAKGTCLALLRIQGGDSGLVPHNPASENREEIKRPKRGYRSSKKPHLPFDPDKCRHSIAEMIIKHDYPLHIIEDRGFISFVQSLQPQFGMVGSNFVRGDCVATYLMKRQNIVKFIEGMPGRVCLTLDMWSSAQDLVYVFTTGHFIDCDWKPQRRLLNVVMEPFPDSDNALSHAVASCLSDWGLERKLLSVTFNCSVGKSALENLRSLLCVKKSLILNGQLLIGSCIARSLSSAAKDVLLGGLVVVQKIRDSVKYMTISDSQQGKFLLLKERLRVPSKKRLSLDDKSQWNTTFEMLMAALELREVFSCFGTSDPNYKAVPSTEDWKQVEIICTCLKPLYDAANTITPTVNVAAITIFQEVWKIQVEFSHLVSSEDYLLSNLAKGIKEKIDEYWKNCSLILASVVVMDPRFKMKLVEFSFTKSYGKEAPVYVKRVDDAIHELFLEYVPLPLPLTPTYSGKGTFSNNEGKQGSLVSNNGFTDFDSYIMETTGQQTMKSELDQYLDESLMPRVGEFDILHWWRMNEVKFPNLSKMARDILTITVSSVAPDSVFDTEIKQLDNYQSSLGPEILEALLCAKDWLQCASS